MRFAAVLLLFIALPLQAEEATARYAPAQLQVAEDSLAGRLAWEASVDARLAWGMSDSAAVRGPAARIFQEASRIIHDAATQFQGGNK